MRITITLSETDAHTFAQVAAQPVFELVEKAVIARHFFCSGLKQAALSLDKCERIVEVQKELSEQPKRRKVKKKARAK